MSALTGGGPQCEVPAPNQGPAPSSATTRESESTGSNPAVGALRATLEAAGGSMAALTVLSTQNDPFRCDTPAGHRDAAWLANTLSRLDIGGQRHLRGLHYILIGQPKPDGKPYANTDADWTWLALTAKAARWLNYVPFDRIVDQRNDAPVVRKWTPPQPEPCISVNLKVVIPDADDLTPLVWVDGPGDPQPYHLVLVGEKSSLRPVLSEIADDYRADLYLPTGEMSDTQAHAMAEDAARDGRPLRVFYFADCDPSGWQMPISLSRKLQALKALAYPDLRFDVHRVGLTPDQVREYGLPSTPLKDTEKRADRWTAAHGVAQTEIDSLAALQPELLRRIADESIGPFFDSTLDQRVREAIYAWEAEAQAIVDQQADDSIDRLREEAVELLAQKRAEIQQIMDTVRIDAGSFDLPEIALPAPELDAIAPEPLCSSDWDFRDQCRRLRASKVYEDSGVTA